MSESKCRHCGEAVFWDETGQWWVHWRRSPQDVRRDYRPCENGATKAEADEDHGPGCDGPLNCTCETTCANCGETIARDESGWYHDATNARYCDGDDQADHAWGDDQAELAEAVR